MKSSTISSEKTERMDTIKEIGAKDVEAPLLESHNNNNNSIQKNKEKLNQKTEIKEDDTLEPADGGWGWFVAVGCMVCTMLLSTQGPCFGIYYGDRLRELGSSLVLVSWIFNLQAFTWNIAGPWAGPLVRKFGHRLVAFVGAFIACLSMILSIFVTNPNFLILTFSMLSGIGGGICINCCFQLNARYFKRRLGVANGIMVTGTPIGNMLMPQLASYLQGTYNFEWSTLIAGAVMFNTVAATLLFQPPEWHMKKSVTEVNDDEDDLFESISSLKKHVKPITNRFPIFSRRPSTPFHNRTRSFPRGMSVPQNLMNPNSHNLHIKENGFVRKRPASECGDSGLRKLSEVGLMETPRSSVMSIYSLGGTAMMGSVLTLPPINEPEETTKSDVEGQQEEAPNQSIWKKICSNFQPSVFKDPIALSIPFFSCITITTAINIYSQMPFIFNDAGYTLQDSASAMSIVSVTDLVTRLVCACVLDRPWINPIVLYAFGQLICILVPLVIVKWSDFWWIISMCMSVYGIALGILYSLDVFLIVHLLGVQKLQAVFGTAQIFRAVMFLVNGATSGALRDLTGSYTYVLFVFCGNMTVAFLIVLFTICYTRCKPRKDT